MIGPWHSIGSGAPRLCLTNSIETKEIFLSNFNGRPGPRRPAFIFVNDLSYDVRDEVVSFCFSLRSGAYATTFLSYLFQLDTDGLEVEDK